MPFGFLIAFKNQVLRIILCKPSWFAQTAVKEKREKFFR